MNKKILVVIPARDEAKNIATVLKKIRESYLGVVVTKLVVDDGSTDETAVLAASFGARVIKNKKSRGVCLSVLSGFRWGLKRNFDFFVVIDADGQHVPGYISQVIEKLTSGYDVVSFSRFSRQSKVLYEPPTTEKYVINAMLAAGLARFSGADLTDAMCGFFGLTKEAFKKMGLGKDRGYGLTLEVLLKTKFFGLSLVQLPHPCIYFDGYPTKFCQYYQTNNHLGERMASYVQTIVSVLEEVKKRDHKSCYKKEPPHLGLCPGLWLGKRRLWQRRFPWELEKI